MHTESTIRARLRDWITRTNGGLADGDLRDDTPIFEDGIITSVDAMELIFVIEELRGAEIDVARLDPASLRSIDSMCGSFFSARVLESGHGS